MHTYAKLIKIRTAMLNPKKAYHFSWSISIATEIMIEMSEPFVTNASDLKKYLVFGFLTKVH